MSTKIGNIYLLLNSHIIVAPNSQKWVEEISRVGNNLSVLVEDEDDDDDDDDDDVDVSDSNNESDDDNDDENESGEVMRNKSNGA